MSLFCFVRLHHLYLPSYQKILLCFGIWSVSEISFLPFVWCKVQRIQCWDGRVSNTTSGVRNCSTHVAPRPKHLAPPQFRSSIIREPWLASSSIFKSFPLLQALTPPCGRNGWSAWRERRRRLREQNTLVSGKPQCHLAQQCFKFPNSKLENLSGIDSQKGCFSWTRNHFKLKVTSVTFLWPLWIFRFVEVQHGQLRGNLSLHGEDTFWFRKKTKPLNLFFNAPKVKDTWNTF